MHVFKCRRCIIGTKIHSFYLKIFKKIYIFVVNEEERKKTLKELRSILEENCSESARIVAANQIKEQLELTFDPEAKNIEQIIRVKQL